MTKNNLLEATGFDSMEELYEGILSLRKTGNLATAQALYGKMSKTQREDFVLYVEESYYYAAHDEGFTSELKNLLADFIDVV